MAISRSIPCSASVAHSFDLIRVTTGARIGNLELFAHRWRDEPERVAADVDIGDRLFDLRHVAGDAVAARTAFRMVRVIFDRGRMRAIGRARRVTVETDRCRRLSELGIVLRAVRVMTRRARDAPAIHDALDEIVALHAILVGGAVGKVRERGFAERVRLELPIILQPQSDVVADRPVVRFPVDEAAAWLPLGMALDAGIG